ncbi:MAG: hypothetical protein ABEI86_10370, partial [Halobacteriaceae archaeon]
MLFRDYLTWFRDTLRFIKDQDHTNWLIKQHPHVDKYDCNQTVQEEIDRMFSGNEEHIVYLENDVNTKSLQSVVDA